jgi:hypothetical protein
MSGPVILTTSPKADVDQAENEFKAEASGGEDLAPKPDSDDLKPLAEEPWILAPHVFPAPPAAADAILGQLSGEGRPLPSPGFLGEAVGSVHESVDY